MPRPLTQEERDRFEEIRFGDLENVCLIQTAYDGVETAVICVVQQDGEMYDVFPVAVLLTEEMTEKVTPPSPDFEPVRR